jgi:Spy/CpxP family protein refolding chaperone
MRPLFVALGVLLSVGAANLVNAQERFVERVQDLDLTDQQEAKIADIQKECQPKVQEAKQALGALVQEEVNKIREVLNAEQKQKVQALRDARGERADRQDRREECLAHAVANLKELDLTDAEMTKIGEIRTEFRPQMAKAVKELEGLLTDAQKQARENALASGKSRKEVLQALQLTAAQKEKVAAVGKELRATVRGELEQIQSVLSAGQEEKVQELRGERKERVRDRRAYRIANLPDLNLTAEQKTKIASIREEYRPKIQEAGNTLRAAARDGVQQIVAVIKG